MSRKVGSYSNKSNKTCRSVFNVATRFIYIVFRKRSTINTDFMYHIIIKIVVKYARMSRYCKRLIYCFNHVSIGV
ncbi:protein of unknown function (plasmid) [Lactiplantibacillus plantarum]